MRKNIIKISLTGIVVCITLSTTFFSAVASTVPTESPAESTKEYDDLQKMFLEIDKDITEDELQFCNEYKAREVIEKYCSFMPVEIYLTDAARVRREEKEAEEKEEKTPFGYAAIAIGVLLGVFGVVMLIDKL